MLKKMLRGVIVSLALCLTLAGRVGAAGAEDQSWEKAGEFIKLLNEAENYFLDEDYEQAKEAFDKAGVIFGEQAELIQDQVFFNFSTPENTVRSFLESAFLKDEEKARRCWSQKIPSILVKMMACEIREIIEDTYKGTPELELAELELADIQFLKVMAETIYYKRTEGGINSYYVWVMLPRSKDESRNMRFKVIKEDDNWKILLRKAWEEEEEFLKALLAEKK